MKNLKTRIAELEGVRRKARPQPGSGLAQMSCITAEPPVSLSAELLDALEAVEAGLCDLYGDLEAYGDKSRGEQVSTLCKKAREVIAKTRAK